jgi:hypothetical protein
VVYDVHATNADGSRSRFDYEHQEEALKVGDPIYHEQTIYKVARILPAESDEYDAIVKTEQETVGPPQFADRVS